MDNLIYLANIFLGLAGFAVVLYIRHKKSNQKALICPLNMKCEQVIYSRYSKFLGVSVEIFGILYYGLIVVSYLIFLLSPTLINPLAIFAIFSTSLAGFLFSTYLLSVQLFKLREWCSWCLASSFISTLILVISSQTASVSSVLMSASYDYQILLVIIYALALCIGFGLTTALEIIFVRFLRSSTVSKREDYVLYILRQLIWVTLGIIVISNYLMYLTDPLALSMSPRFILKIGILALMVVINLINDFFIHSNILKSFFLSSWFMILFIEMTQNVPLSVAEISALYLLILAATATAGQMLGIKTVTSS